MNIFWGVFFGCQTEFSKQNILTPSLSSDDVGQANSQIIESRTIFGIIGIINLIAGPYLIVITKRNHIGDINDRSIFQVQETEIISFRRTTTHLTEKQVAFNNAYITMIKSVLNTPYFYFSYTYDLSHSMQRIYNNGSSFANKSLLERADQRFIWNRALMSRFFEDQELISFCLPIIHGCEFERDCVWQDYV